LIKHLVIVINNISSPQRLIDIAKVVYNSEVSNLIKAFVLTRVGGGVIQSGIPEVSKLAYKLGKSLVILPTLNDAIEVFNPSKVFLVGKSPDSLLLEDLELSDDTMLAFSGSDSGFAKNELALGRQVYFKGFNQLVSPVAEVALTLYIINLKISGTS